MWYGRKPVDKKMKMMISLIAWLWISSLMEKTPERREILQWMMDIVLKDEVFSGN